jgi:hypothetical protein
MSTTLIEILGCIEVAALTAIILGILIAPSSPTKPAPADPDRSVPSHTKPRR